MHEPALIAVNFPRFVDGRGYSIALLRERYGYSGELRAIGDVLPDQLQFMKRCGFDAFALRPDKDATKAARLNFFSQTYQAAADTDVPLFRRRATRGSPLLDLLVTERAQHFPHSVLERGTRSQPGFSGSVRCAGKIPTRHPPDHKPLSGIRLRF